MRRSLKAVARLIYCLLLILWIVSAGAGQNRRFSGNREAQPYTRNLPAIDRVELLKLKKEGDLWWGEIESTRSVGGIEAQKIASLWRRQTYYPYSAVCHFPGYAIKFFSKNKLILYASLCWECNNIGFVTPHLKRTQGFGGDGAKGQQLLQVFRAAFPAANQERITKVSRRYVRPEKN